jgi:hypothetical protein
VAAAEPTTNPTLVNTASARAAIRTLDRVLIPSRPSRMPTTGARYPASLAPKRR